MRCYCLVTFIRIGHDAHETLMRMGFRAIRAGADFSFSLMFSLLLPGNRATYTIGIARLRMAAVSILASKAP